MNAPVGPFMICAVETPTRRIYRHMGYDGRESWIRYEYDADEGDWLPTDGNAWDSARVRPRPTVYDTYEPGRVAFDDRVSRSTYEFAQRLVLIDCATGMVVRTHRDWLMAGVEVSS